ncbi:hypothetical protein [Herbaspirillum rubrisubalbicans]|uniref:hypothetical protein n=1 Tax=Herbaspirillum rubrisubalbicans TaxID=80842 RepID=UPI000AE60899|nr:hypothetical protein [Herbaspirillum rubrisubalbicans]
MRIIKTLVATVLFAGFASAVFAKPSLHLPPVAEKNPPECVTDANGQTICF